MHLRATSFDAAGELTAAGNRSYQTCVETADRQNDVKVAKRSMFRYFNIPGRLVVAGNMRLSTEDSSTSAR